MGTVPATVPERDEGRGGPTRGRSAWPRRAAVLVLVGLLAGVVAVVPAGRGRERPAAPVPVASQRDPSPLAEAIAEADRLDPGWRIEDLLARSAEVPEGRNSAEHAAAAHRLIPRGWSDPGLVPLIRRRGPRADLGPALLEALRVELTALAPALEQARSLEQFPEGHFRVSYDHPTFVLIRLDYVNDARLLFTLLYLDAVLRAERGDADGALHSVRALLNVGRTFGEAPFLIVQLVRFVGHGMAADALRRALARGAPSRAALESTRRLLEDEAARPLLLIGVRGERAGFHELMQGLECGTLPFIETGNDLSEVLGSGPPGVLGKIDVVLQNLSQSFRHSHAVFLRQMTRAVEIAKLPTERHRAEFEAWESEMAGASPFALMLLPDLPMLSERNTLAQARLRCAIAALAAEGYRREHGAWPESLEHLAPRPLRQVPADPFDGRALRYRRLDDGIVIYTVGSNLRDDGGRFSEDEAEEDKGPDVGFRLWDADRRPKPAGAASPPSR